MRRQIIVEDPHRTARNRRAPSYISYEPAYYVSNRRSFWEVAWDKSKDFVQVLACAILISGILYGLNWIDDKYSIVSKAKAYFSQVSEPTSKNASAKSHNREYQQEVPISQTKRLTVSCCVCNTQFDATQFSHYAAFDCDCPGCGSILHVENQN